MQGGIFPYCGIPASTNSFSATSSTSGCSITSDRDLNQNPAKGLSRRGATAIIIALVLGQAAMGLFTFRSLDDVTNDRPILNVDFCSQYYWAHAAREFQERGLAVVAIASNDPTTHPQDGPDAMAVEAMERGYVFPYLFDETQEVAKAYGAACTPDFFLYDGDRRLVYRGQFDPSRPGNDIPVTGSDLRAASEAVLAGRAPSEEQVPSVGCNIKWAAGNEPDYFGA